MKVGLVVPGFSANARDWCIPALRHLARALATTDDVRVIAVRYPYTSSRYAIEGADVIAIGGADRRGPASFDIWRRTLDVLRQEHQRSPFDVLHAFWATESGLLAAMAGRILRIPTLVSLAGGELIALPAIDYGDQRTPWERLKVGASLRLASAVSAGSRQLLSLAQHHVPGRQRLRWAPLGVDLDLFQPGPPRTPDQPRLLHVGALTPIKDQATLLHAFSGLQRRVPGVSLEVVGDGPVHAELNQLADELGISEAVRFTGSVDHAALPVVYRHATAFVLSSRHEAQGMVVVEAAACGAPIVGTRVGVVPELAWSGNAIAPVGATDALAEALAATCDSSPGTGAAAYEVARAEFGLGPCIERFRGLYAELNTA